MMIRIIRITYASSNTCFTNSVICRRDRNFRGIRRIYLDYRACTVISTVGQNPSDIVTDFASICSRSKVSRLYAQRLKYIGNMSFLCSTLTCHIYVKFFSISSFFKRLDSSLRRTRVSLFLYAERKRSDKVLRTS